MADLSKNTEARFTLDGQSFNAPIDWEDITIEANYENDSIQPSITAKDFQFPLESREFINDWIQNGLNGGVGIFEGIPFDITLFNNQQVQENFKSFIAFTEGYTDFLEDGVVETSIIKDDGLDQLFDKMEATTYGYLELINVFSNSDYIDVDYVVEKKFNLIDILITSVILYLMVKELALSARNSADGISSVVALTAIPLNGQIGAAIRVVAITLINLTYTAVLLIAIINLARTLLDTLLPPQRTHKALTLRTALSKVATHFGYNLVAPIDELDNLVYLPSNPNLDNKTFFGLIDSVKGTQSGIPNVIDFGYKCDEMFNLAKELFDAKLAIIGQDLHLRPKNDPFWEQQSTWNLPDILIETLEYNTDEMRAERLLSFEVDLNDEWTIDNYEGTSYEIRTEPLVTLRERAVLLKGIDEINFNVALGNRKDELNGLERLLKTVAIFIDTVTGVFGGGSSFAIQITSKIGVLKQSNNWHSLPKLLYLNGSVMPVNHRDLFKAKNLYDKYHKDKSFVLDNYRNQKKVYNNVVVPFGFEDYKELLQNGYFFFNGIVAKIINFEWTIGQDVATISFWIREPYTRNLKELYIEAR